jgi:adenylosuccinate lyase
VEGIRQDVTVMVTSYLNTPWYTEQLKRLTRGRRLDRRQFAAFVRRLKIPLAAKKRLLALTPARYVGLAAELARRI